MTYKLNLNNRAIQARCLKALEFVDKYVRTNSDGWLSSKWIQHKDNFGKNAAGLYLKKFLLKETNSKYKKGSKCKQYRKNVENIAWLKQQLGLEDTETHSLFKKHEQELVSGDFDLKEKSHREYHSLQFLPTEFRAQLFAHNGYRFNFDLKCANITLLYQHAQQLGLKKPLTAIEYYIANKSLIRERLSRLCDFETAEDKKLIKKLLTGLANGQKLSCSYDCQVARDFNYRFLLIKRLQCDLFLKRYREELAMMWKIIKRGRGLSVRLNHKIKADIYFQLEKQVRDLVKNFLKKKKIKVFTEHDGWRTNEMYDQEELRSYIKSQSGFTIEVDWEVI